MGRDGRALRASRPPVTMDGAVEAGGVDGGAIPISPPGTTRRTLLTRGLAVAAGALGASVAASGAVLGAAPAAGLSTLTLVVHDVRFRTSAAQREAKTPASPHGTLSDAEGRSVGSFSAGVLAGSGGGISVQRFTLADGTLIGIGSGALHGADYAIVGGTGRYSGATGSYTTQLTSGARGRDAAFRISLTGTKG